MKGDQRKELYLTRGEGMKVPFTYSFSAASLRKYRGSIRNKGSHCSVRALGELTWDILFEYSVKFSKYNIYKTG